jgi:RNA polymerase sigma factor (sigma-70 family)
MATRSHTDAEDHDLLRRLNSVDAGAAWAEFLDRYSPLIMRVAAQIEFEQDRIDECFLYVCEKLSEDGFKRLLKFKTSGAAKLSTWLSTVVFNLCVDWHRREYGRVRMLPAISALPEFDQSVYRLIHEQGMNRESAYQRLRSDHPDLSRASINNALDRIHGVLTPRQRWRMSLSVRRESPAKGRDLVKLEQFPDYGHGPDSVYDTGHETRVLQEALSKLPLEQRLLIYWRFQEGLSLKRIAELADLGNTNRAWKEVQLALATLFEYSPELRQIRNKKN